ncbi:MAG TPA: CDP-alcohol phosphatidyltransferase family protein [Gammaproteobacteria bacterium]|nr:CDP-alcohol phosphatidyltransferase family protein [Gammaproteobacteria bacterium]
MNATEALPRPVRHIPNIISALRILLVIPVVMLLLERQYGAALILFAIAGISDGVDGFLAKHFGWQSRLGSILDPLADKLLLVGSFLSLAWLGLIPLALVVAVMLRDVIIVLGAIALHYRYGRFEMQPTRVSKVNTFFQIVLVLAVVFYHGEFAQVPWIVDSLVYIVWATTLISGANYVWIWGRHVLRNPANSG